MDLERRINLLQGEREGLSSTLDESADRIIMLEKQSREQDSLVSISIRPGNQLPYSSNQTLITLSIHLDVAMCLTAVKMSSVARSLPPSHNIRLKLQIRGLLKDGFLIVIYIRVKKHLS